MRSDIIIQSFLGGLLLMGTCFLGMIIGAGALVVIISHFLPGLVFAFLLVQNIIDKVSGKRKVLFVLLSTAIHIACVFFVDVANENKIATPIKLIIASSFGALLLSLAYDFLIVGRLKTIRTFVVPLALGVLASLLSAFCLYYLHQVDFEQDYLETLLWAGIFSVFPIWFTLIAWNIKERHKTPTAL
jgi:hypothetical protein